MPFVGPREHEDPGAARRKGQANLPVQRRRLALLAVAAAVEADLGDDERKVVGDVLKPRQVGVEGLRSLEVDVEARQVEERQVQVLGRGEVDVGDQSLRILLLGGAVEALDEALDPAATVPADDRRGDLVADDVAEDSGVPGARAHSLAHDLLDPARSSASGKKRHVLLPG